MISQTYIYTRQIDNKILRPNTHDIGRNQEKYDTGHFFLFLFHKEESASDRNRTHD